MVNLGLNSRSAGPDKFVSQMPSLYDLYIEVEEFACMDAYPLCTHRHLLGTFYRPGSVSGP